MTCSM